MIKTTKLTKNDIGKIVVFDNFQMGKVVGWNQNRVNVDYGFGVFPTPPCQLRFASISERVCGNHGRCLAVAAGAILMAYVGAVAAIPSVKIAAGFLIAAAVYKKVSSTAAT